MWCCNRVLRIHFEGYCWICDSQIRRYHRIYLWTQCWWWCWQHLRQLRCCWLTLFWWLHSSNYCYYFSMRTELFGIPSQNHRAMAVPQLRAQHANDEILLDRWLTLKSRQKYSQRLNAFAGFNEMIFFVMAFFVCITLTQRYSMVPFVYCFFLRQFSLSLIHRFLDQTRLKSDFN